MDYGFDINGIVGVDFLKSVGAVIDLNKMELRKWETLNVDSKYWLSISFNDIIKLLKRKLRGKLLCN